MFGSRTLLPAVSLTPARFDLVAQGPGGATASASTAEEVVMLADLPVGDWQVTVRAVNAAEEPIGQGTADIRLPNGEPQTLAIEVLPLAGDGTLSLEVNWTASELANPLLEAALAVSGQPAMPLAFDLSVPGKGTCTRPGIPAGFYTLAVRLLDGGTLKAGAVEVVLIIADKTTSGFFDFTNLSLAEGRLQVRITPQLPRAVDVRLYGQLDEIGAGDSLTLAAEAAGEPGIAILWYLNAQPVGMGGSLTIEGNLAVGLYRVDAVALDAVQKKGGSAGHLLKVLPAVIPGSLTYASCITDGQGETTDLGGARRVAADSQARNVYATAYTDGALLVFRRDESTGRLVFLQVFSGLAGASGLDLSPAGENLYATGYQDNSLVGFSRDPATGTLTPLQAFRKGEEGLSGLGGAKALAFSPDGLHLYVANHLDNSISLFARDPSTGRLTWFEDVVNGSGGVLGLEGPEDLAVSPDGAHLFASGYTADSLVVFRRDPATGRLQYLTHLQDGAGGVDGLNGAGGVAVSSDGASLYLAGYYDSAVAVFRRNTTTGELSYTGCLKDGSGFVEGLHYARDLALGPGEDTLYVSGSGDDAVALFRRDPATGALTFSACYADGQKGVAGLDGVRGLVATRDGKSLYAAGSGQGTLVAFNRYAR
jgi:6-phosphogluconolactonase (cycloisomerase 2 family)